MARILFGWELGFGFGHIANLLPVAKALANMGHEPVFVLRDVVGTWPLMRDAGFSVLPSPVFFNRPHFTDGATRSYADLLARHGYDDPEALEPIVRAWRELLAVIQPELVVAEHSPSLCVACVGRIPVVNLGTGFTIPYAADGRFADLDSDATELVPIARINSTISTVLHRLGQDTPNPAIAAVLGDEQLAIVIKELDPYQQERSQASLGPLTAMPSLTSLPSEPSCLVYLPADHPKLELILSGLVNLPIKGIAYVRDATPKIIDWLRATPLEVVTQPLDLNRVLPNVSAVLHHGGVGITQQCLFSGRPQVIAPMYLEQDINCTAIQELGVAIRLDRIIDPAKSGAALVRAAETPKLRQLAQRQAQEIHMRYPRPALDKVVNTCLKRLQPHSFKPNGLTSTKTPIHLIHSFENINGGSEQRAIHLYYLLKAHTEVTLWSEYEPDPSLLAKVPIRRIDVDGTPSSGTLVLISTYYRVGAWFEKARPQRLIILYNVDAPTGLEAWLKRAEKPWYPKLELIFASGALAAKTGLKGVIQESPIDLARFCCTRDYSDDQRNFTIGRLSRDVAEKHHPDDIALYQELAKNGCKIRIMGGTVLQQALANTENIELLAEGAELAESFLASLDVFIYRTHEAWFEASGRVVSEAMASGLPVVCHERGGYTEKIHHGKNGFIYKSQAQAHEIINALRTNPSLQASIGEAAQHTMQLVYGTDLEQKICDYYTQQP